MTLPLLVLTWLGGIYFQSVASLPVWALGLGTPLARAIILLWWREGRVRLAASCCLFLLLGALRFAAAIPGFDESHLAYYNGQGEVTLTGMWRGTYSSGTMRILDAC
jgi:hypothetical protein